METTHIPVLLPEVMHFLKVKNDKTFVDGTLGGGGHTLAMLGSGAEVIAIDRDEEAIERAKSRIKRELGELPKNLVVVKGNFAEMDKILERLGVAEVDGILLDLGLSSDQLDNPERGFSFRFDAPLDMRMDKRLSVTAKDLVNGLTRDELVELFVKYADVYKPMKVANAIVEARREQPIETTTQLARIIADAYGRMWQRKIHPATQPFQALRIAVNDEYESLIRALAKGVDFLKLGARIAVISFHSIEDRAVKVAFSQDDRLMPITRKPVTAGKEEADKNPRARSAKLRVAERVK